MTYLLFSKLCDLEYILMTNGWPDNRKTTKIGPTYEWDHISIQSVDDLPDCFVLRGEY